MSGNSYSERMAELETRFAPQFALDPLEKLVYYETTLDRILDEVVKEVCGALEDVETARGEAEDLEKALEDLKKQLETKQEELGQADDRIGELQEQLQDADAAIAELKREVQSLKDAQQAAPVELKVKAPAKSKGKDVGGNPFTAIERLERQVLALTALCKNEFVPDKAIDAVLQAV